MRAGASPSQNGIVGGSPARVLDAHAAGLDAADAPRRVAEQEDVAGHATRSRSPRRRVPTAVPSGSSDDVVVGVVGDRAARGERREPRAAPAASRRVHAVAVQVRAARGRGASAMPSASMSTHLRRSPRARASAYGRRAAAQRRRARPRPARSAAQIATICWARTSSGASRSAIASSSPRRGRAHERRALDSWSRVSGNSRPFGVAPSAWPERPTRCSTRRDRARRAELADEIDGADVDAELERRGRDHHLQLAGLEPLLGVEAPRARQAAVVRGDALLAEPLARAWRATRSTSRRVLTNTSVERCARASSAMRS